MKRFYPDEILQRSCAIQVDRNTIAGYTERGLAVPNGILARLMKNEAYLAVQIARWGVDAINEGCDLIHEGRLPWEMFRDLFPSSTADAYD